MTKAGARDTVDAQTPLHDIIRNLIRVSGPMPVWRYMELCLSHHEHGYYVNREPLGREGDFITAPEVSQMFGELIGLWIAAVWRDMDKPQAINIVELGPGRGTMMADALRAIRVVPPLYQAISVHLVEINPKLREKQRNMLASRNVRWYNSLSEVPRGPSIYIANEYFDVLPIHQMVKGENGWHERMVEMSANGELSFGVAKEPMPQFDLLVPPLVQAAPRGAIYEWRADHEIMTLATRVRDDGGAALIVDYGHLRSDVGDTLQAMAKHAYADPLIAPGRADITAHVDFQALARAAEDIGAVVHGPVTQGKFLHRLGIETRAETLRAKASSHSAADITGALQRLTGSGRGTMGTMFKVLALSNPALTSLVGFTDDGEAAPAKAG